MSACDFNRMLDLHPPVRRRRRNPPEFAEDIQDAALAVERVLAAAYERGSADAIAILSSVSALLRGLASTDPRAKTASASAPVATRRAAKLRAAAASRLGKPSARATR